ncbi:MAG: HipA domain-containing protein [Oscillospiraceae bacterium]|nr:HipA domain-containing protein [Oscillospiraceae bacterium]
MRCLHCGKEISSHAELTEQKNRWHRRCIKKFFGTKELPMLDITEEQLEQLANDTVNQGLTVPGVQRKMSIHLSTDIDTKLTIVDYPTGYILKPQTKEYENLPEYEDLSMRMAEVAGIQTVPHALMRMNDQYAYITRRIDRDIQGKQITMYAMEDFCQLAERLTADKYRGSYELCARIIKRHSILPGFDLSELFLRLVFSFLTGNSDMHLKNFSLREQESGKRNFCLSKAYDMLPVNVIIPEDQEQLALTLNGKKRNIRKKDFITFAEKCDIPVKSAEKIIRKVCSLKEKFIKACDESYLPEMKKEEMKQLITCREEILQ